MRKRPSSREKRNKRQRKLELNVQVRCLIDQE